MWWLIRDGQQILRGVFYSILFLCGTVGFVANAAATEIIVKTEPGALADAIASAVSGDVLVLQEGRHLGPITLDKSVHLTGQKGAIIDGQGKGTVITITAENVIVSGLKIINSGENLPEKNSGIFVDKPANNALIEDNFLENNLISVYLFGADDVIVRNNVIFGRQDLRMNERGNGVQLWETPRSKVINNHIRYGRDGIFAMTTKQNVFQGNLIEDTRFAVHYMYADHSILEDNISRNNHVGYALMFSSDLVVRNNQTRNERDHGIALNYANSSEFIGNQVYGIEDKCIFIYNSSKNIFRGNRFEACGIGVHFTAGSERNIVYENAFIANQSQVKYVGTRFLDWAYEGVGNYWSDNPAFDLDGDGIGDAVYYPNDMIDRVVWAYPMAKLLLNSPTVQIIRWAQSAFPALRTGGVFDSAPLMAAPEIPVSQTQEISKTVKENQNG